jgi:hypothetical protein
LRGQVANFSKFHAKKQATFWQSGLAIQHSERMQFWRDTWGDDWHPIYARD